MARMMGRTKTLAWWMVGVCCAMVFGRAWASAAEAQAEYGIRARPRQAAKPAVTEEQKKQANKLVDEYLAGGSQKLTADEEKKIAKLVCGWINASRCLMILRLSCRAIWTAASCINVSSAKMTVR